MIFHPSLTKDYHDIAIPYMQVSRDLAITPEKPTQPIFVYVAELLSEAAAYYRSRVVDEAERFTLVSMILKLMAFQAGLLDEGTNTSSHTRTHAHAHTDHPRQHQHLLPHACPDPHQHHTRTRTHTYTCIQGSPPQSCP